MTQEEFIKTYLAISKESPSGLIWTGHPSKKHLTLLVGKAAGCIRPDGYYQTRVQDKTVFNHRAVWLLSHGEWPFQFIDHIDGNRANNLIENLRLATFEENQHNKRAKGCCFQKSSGLWLSRITVNKVVHSLGYFKTEKEANEAYLEAKRNLHPTASEHCF